MTPTIKIATDKDFPSIVPLMNKANEYFTRIVNETRGKNAPQNKPFRFHDGMLATARFLYMEVKDTPITCLTMDHWPLQTPVVVLDDLWVEPEYRRKGYGKALVEYAMDMIHKAERHAEIGILAGNTGASAFWHSIIPSLVKMHTYYYIP